MAVSSRQSNRAGTENQGGTSRRPRDSPIIGPYRKRKAKLRVSRLIGKMAERSWSRGSQGA
jgi:hypothetical protein